MTREEETLRQPSPLKDIQSRASGGAYEEPLEFEVGTPVMTKQEEIREGIFKVFEPIPREAVEPIVRDLLAYLHSQGIRLPDGSSLVKKLDTP